MHKLLKALDDAMGEKTWPDRWMAMWEIAVELDQSGFWTRFRVAPSNEGRLALLDQVFLHDRGARQNPFWAEINRHFKHVHKLNGTDYAELRDWNDSCRTFAHQLSTGALTGKRIPWPSTPPAPGPNLSVADGVAVIEALFDELARLAAEVEWTALASFVREFRQRLTRRPTHRLEVVRSAAIRAPFLVAEQLDARNFTPGHLPVRVAAIRNAVRHIHTVLESSPGLGSSLVT
jgi:hypothetical protein